MRGSLRGYLGTCVANRVRDKMRRRGRVSFGSNDAESIVADGDGPGEVLIWGERSRELTRALGELPFEQREVVVLHLCGGMKYREIAAVQGESINTVKSRYRYGLEKLRALLPDEVKI